MMTAKAAATLCFSISASLFAGSCGRYADFTLPAMTQASRVPAIRLHFEARPVISGQVDSLNPSVASYRGEFYNLYSAYDGRTWHTNLATSSDGMAWVLKGKAISPDAKTWEGDYIAANGSVIAHNGELWYWYQAGDRATPRIGLARSADGRTWRKERQPVVELGPFDSWDERGVADPYVFEKQGWLYLYYLGQNRARQQQLGLARSRDGIRWERLRANPVLAIGNEAGLGEPAVWEQNGAYWMLYTARDAHENRTIALARSADGVQWERMGQPMRGSEAWDSKVICDPAVLGNRFWFGGGDVASPDENLHGQIGTGELK